MSVGLASPPLFDLLESKLGWIESRQRVLSQNIANADTPGYRTRDVAPFSAHLQAFAVTPAQTNPMHLAGFVRSASTTRAQVQEKAPDGNAVGLEDELAKVADDENAQALTGNLWKSYMGMFMTALGHG